MRIVWLLVLILVLDVHFLRGALWSQVVRGSVWYLWFFCTSLFLAFYQFTFGNWIHRRERLQFKGNWRHNWRSMRLNWLLSLVRVFTIILALFWILSVRVCSKFRQKQFHIQVNVVNQTPKTTIYRLLKGWPSAIHGLMFFLVKQ